MRENYSHEICSTHSITSWLFLAPDLPLFVSRYLPLIGAIVARRSDDSVFPSLPRFWANRRDETWDIENNARRWRMETHCSAFLASENFLVSISSTSRCLCFSNSVFSRSVATRIFCRLSLVARWPRNRFRTSSVLDTPVAPRSLANVSSNRATSSLLASSAPWPLPREQSKSSRGRDWNIIFSKRSSSIFRSNTRSLIIRFRSILFSNIPSNLNFKKKRKSNPCSNLYSSRTACRSLLQFVISISSFINIPCMLSFKVTASSLTPYIYIISYAILV